MWISKEEWVSPYHLLLLARGSEAVPRSIEHAPFEYMIPWTTLSLAGTRTENFPGKLLIQILGRTRSACPGEIGSQIGLRQLLNLGVQKDTYHPNQM